MSISVRSQIATALDTKYVPPFTPGDLGNLGSQLGLFPPFSCLDLIHRLQGLPALQVLFPTGTLSPDTVTGWAQLMVASDGMCSFRTHIHEGGAVGHNYSIALVLLDVKDANGKALTWVQSGSVAGYLDIGSSTDDQQQNGPSQVVAQHWDLVKNNARYNYDLKVSTDPWQVIESALVGALVVAAAIFTGSKTTNCEWGGGIAPDDKGQPGVEVRVRCQ